MKEFSGDGQMTKINRIKYLLFNFVRGVMGHGVFLKTKYWRPKKIRKAIASPGREYSDDFLYENLRNLFLGKEIKMLDIGCGSGYVRKIFHDLGYSLYYSGVDIAKHRDFDVFSKYSISSNFTKSRIEDFNLKEKYDIIFSISALEHIENDVSAVSKTFQFLKPKGIQIHIVPAFWSLFLYLWHGYRQYTPARLKKMFKGKIFKVYRIGGFFSFLLHFFFITIPEIFFRTNKLHNLKIYPKLIKIVNKLDRFIPILSFTYIIIIKK